MGKVGKRFTAFLLAFLLFVSNMPQTVAYAAEYVGEETVEQGTEIVEQETEADTEVSDTGELDSADRNEYFENQDVLDEADAQRKVEEQEKQSITGEDKAVLLNYVAVDSSYLTAPNTQNIVVGIGDGAIVAERAVLTYVNETTGEQREVGATGISEGAILFAIGYNDVDEHSTYRLLKVNYSVAGKEYEVILAEVGLDIRYGVNQQVDTAPNDVLVNEGAESEELQDAVKMDVVSIDENGNQTSQNSIGEAIDEVKAELGTGDENAQDGINTSDKYANGNVVVVLDPGHGGSDAGTSANGLKEKDLNLKIAQYCKAELEQYKGVKVYLTRTNDSYVNLEDRTTIAQNYGANVFVSIHINQSNDKNVSGVEIYYPNANYNGTVSSQGSALASKIISQLAALGLKNRGTKIRNASDYKYPDNTQADYYSVIRTAKVKGIPGIVVEHAFISNAGDVSNYLNSDEKLKKLGVADATGIAQYFGLSKQGKLTIDSIGLKEQKSGVSITANYSTNASSVQFRYLCYDLKSKTWGVISEWTTANTVKWRPQAGSYWVQVAAIDSNGTAVTSTVGFTTTTDYTQKYVELGGICYQINPHSIDVGVAYESDDSNVQFRWQAYNLDNKTWTTISDWKKGNWSTWYPPVGNYWLHVEAVTTSGTSDEYTINFRSNNDYTAMYVDLSGICYQIKDNSIDVGVAYDTNDKNITFQWQAYNLATKQWEMISDWNKGNWATWKPAAGNYWLHVEAKTSTGSQVRDYTISFHANKDYSKNTLNLNGICYQAKESGIDIGVAYATNADSVVFRWQSYNLNTKQWELVTDWNGGNWTTWRPKAGDYWIQVDARTSAGKNASYTICYHNEKDYTANKYVVINGVCVQMLDGVVNLGASYNSNDTGTVFQWQIYDLAKAEWTTLSGWNHSNWTRWYPQSGEYWVYVTAQTSDGKTNSFCQGVKLEMSYTEIMGKSTTTLQQLIRYYNANATYPTYYATANSDAPTITDFCKIYLDECKKEGVRAEVAFAQAMKETDFLKYGGNTKISQYNFVGLGVTGKSGGDSFATVRLGIRAQVQHLKAYASTDSLVNTCVDNQFSSVTRGSAKYVEWLGKNDNPNGAGWPAGSGYGANIKSYMKKLASY